MLDDYGYTTRSDKIFVQCFDPAYTRYLRDELGTDLKLVQLISARQANLTSPDQLAQIAQYADGIGPSMSLVFSFNSRGEPRYTTLVEDAHALNLVVHPYTWRTDALPDNVRGFDQLLEAAFIGADIDGVFTDQADRVVAFVNTLE